MILTYPRLGRMGRLGNQLWQIAGTLAYAQKFDSEISLPPWQYAPYFSVPPEVFSNKDGVDAALFATHLGDAAPYLQDWELVDSVAETLRAWFQPSELSRQLVEQHDGRFASIHIRRTDYLLHPDYYVIPDESWVRKAIDHIHAQDPYIPFLVFSDDQPWCEQHLHEFECLTPEIPASMVNVRDKDGHPLPYPNELSDFWMMVRADRHITANSSFSWWAAWLSDDSEPITPARWYGFRYWYLSEDRIIPPNWMRL